MFGPLGSLAIGDPITPGGVSGAVEAAHFAPLTWTASCSSIAGGLPSAARASAAGRAASSVRRSARVMWAPPADGGRRGCPEARCRRQGIATALAGEATQATPGQKQPGRRGLPDLLLQPGEPERSPRERGRASGGTVAGASRAVGSEAGLVGCGDFLSRQAFHRRDS